MDCEASSAGKETSDAQSYVPRAVKHPSDDVQELDRQKLVDLVREGSLEDLEKLGGVTRITHFLRSSLEQGIKDDDPQELDERRKLFGSNSYPRNPPRSMVNILVGEFKKIFVIMLMLCGLTIALTGLKSHMDWLDGVSIIVVLLAVTLINSAASYWQICCYLGIEESARSIQVEVLRGGTRKHLPSSDLLVGDIVFLKIGDPVPAEGLLLDGHLVVDTQYRSSLAGVTKSKCINCSEPFLLCGPILREGHGQMKMIVTGVGIPTHWGQAGSQAQGGDTAEETPLQVRVKAGLCVRTVGCCVALCVLVVLLSYPLAVHILKGEKYSWKFKLHTLSSLARSMGVAVAVMVVAMAEGLPQAVAFSLATTIKRMKAEDKVLVRRPAQFESMGSVTCVCSDKTGTLTVLEHMAVTKAWVAGEMRDPASPLQGIDQCVCDLLLEGIAQNSTGSVYNPGGGGEPDVTGSPTEKAALLWGVQLGLDYAQVRAQSAVLQVKAFNSVDKRAGVVLRRVADRRSGRVHVHWKGAAQVILAKSNKFFGADGTTRQMGSSERRDLGRVMEGMGAEGLRCIAFSYMQMDGSSSTSDTGEWTIPEGADSTLVAIVGLKNPCRPDVPEAVRQCRMAGIKVRMLTGDSLENAKAVATESEILRSDEDHIAIEGSAFRSDDRLLPKIAVMAASSPSDRLQMINSLRERGEVVAVIGDGVVDAPLLCQADTGLAMMDTQAAKECSDIILLDGSFTSVVSILKWARSHFLTTQKYLQFQLTARLTVILVSAVAVFCRREASTLMVMQLIWVECIIGTLGALALAGEPRSDSVLKRGPIEAEGPLISNVMWRNILSQCCYQVGVLLVLQLGSIKSISHLLKLEHAFGPGGAEKVMQIVVSNGLVLCLLASLVNARKIEEMNILEGILSNRVLLGIVGGTLIGQVMLVEFCLSMFASTVKISWRVWLVSLGIAGLCWPVGCLAKLCLVPQRLTLAGPHRRRISRQQYYTRTRQQS